MVVERWKRSLQVQPDFRNTQSFYFRNALLRQSSISIRDSEAGRRNPGVLPKYLSDMGSHNEQCSLTGTNGGDVMCQAQD